jgi:uncharacterized membrane protein
VSRLRLRRRDDERGAVALVVAITMALVLIASAFVIDLGMQRVVRRDMQALADTVALDAARLLDGRTATDVRAGSGAMRSLAAVVADSVARNGGDTLGDAPQVTPYLVKLDQAGNYPKSANGTPVQVASGDVPDAVVVTAASSVGFAFGGFTGVDSGGATRSAIGSAQRTACFQLGSYAAAINTNNSLLAPLNSLLGIDLDLVSYRGLAGASISLLDLITADPTLGSPDDILTTGLTVEQLADASIAVLQASSPGDPNTAAAITALRALKLAGGVNLTQRVPIGRLLNVGVGDGAGLDAAFNLLDLMAGAVGVANGTRFGDVKTNILGIQVGLNVIQRQQRACGTVGSPNAVAHTSQVTVNATVPEASLGLPASILGLTVSAPGGVRVTGGVGNAEGRLVAPAPQCRSGTPSDPDTMNVAVKTGLLGVNVSTALNINGILGQSDIGTGLLDQLVTGLVNLLLYTVRVRFDNVRIDVGVSAPAAGDEATKTLRHPQNALDTRPQGAALQVGSPVRIGAVNVAGATRVSGSVIIERRSILGGSWSTVSTLSLTDSLVGDLLNLVLGGVVQPVLNGVVGSLNAALLPLLELLGIDVGGARVWAAQRPLCGTPVLVGGGSL